MGRLVLDYHENHKWYFPRSYVDGSGRTNYKIESTFPFYVPLYGPLIHDGSGIKFEIRRDVREFVEDNLAGRVIPIKDFLDLSYKYRSQPGPEDIQCPHWWWIIAFEKEADAVAFKLRFSEVVRPVTLEKPDGPPPYGRQSESRRRENYEKFMGQWCGGSS